MSVSVNDSILNSIKKMLGIADDYDCFDVDVMAAINTALSILHQLGVGDAPISIEGADETWGSIIDSESNLQMIKTYVYLKAKSIFDPTASGTIQNAQTEILKELEWRINCEVDPKRS